MRRPFRRHADSDSDTLDPELLSLFASSTRLPEIGVSDLARGRVRVAAQLAPETAPPVAGGWLKRRFAWGAAGGGSMWAALLGTAFASKASTAAVGVAVLLAGAGTAEVTGIGPAVRESLGISQPSASSNAADESVEAQNNGLGVENAGENAAEQAANVGADSEEPGQQVTHFRPNGTFSMRGTLVSADDVSLTAKTADGSLTLQFADPTISLPAQNANPNDDALELTLDDFSDHLVFFTGVCIEPNEGEDFSIQLHCFVDRVTVLGRAGQGQPDDAGQPDVLPGQAPENAGQPDAPGQPDGTGQLDVQPNGGGQPEDAPPANAQGGNPNSD